MYKEDSPTHKYKEMLDELINLLIQAKAYHWASWFKKARQYYDAGKYEQSYRKVLGAYGGMGSFNDVYWRLPEDEEKRHDFLKDELWTLAKKNLERSS